MDPAPESSFRRPVDRGPFAVLSDAMPDSTRPLPYPTTPAGRPTDASGSQADASGSQADANGRATPSYEAPSLIEVGTLRDLTAAGSFSDPT